MLNFSLLNPKCLIGTLVAHDVDWILASFHVLELFAKYLDSIKVI